jgi:hypothetical protein
MKKISRNFFFQKNLAKFSWRREKEVDGTGRKDGTEADGAGKKAHGNDRPTSAPGARATVPGVGNASVTFLPMSLLS